MYLVRTTRNFLISTSYGYTSKKHSPCFSDQVHSPLDPGGNGPGRDTSVKGFRTDEGSSFQSWTPGADEHALSVLPFRENHHDNPAYPTTPQGSQLAITVLLTATKRVLFVQ